MRTCVQAVGAMSDYERFLASKLARAVPTGIAEAPPLSPKLKEHQMLLTRRCIYLGRGGIYASTGMGKGWCILEYARVVAAHTRRPFLILAPLAVSQQFAREAEKLGTEIHISSGADDVRPGINVTNYQKLHKFDPSVFGGVALDEASILKGFDGKTRKLVIDAFRETPFRLTATATPSPNDHTELGGQAAFLGIMTHAEMLSMYFEHDGGSVQDWYLRPHAREQFWRFVCSWGAIVHMPSDIGCSDDGYALPPLRYHEHIIPASTEDARATGLLFAMPAETLTEQRAARRGTLNSRVQKCAEIMNASDARGIVWSDLNAESAALAKAINGAVEVTGAMPDDEKVAALERFISGDARVLVSKPSLTGFGLNLQFARLVAFCGVTHSFEAFFQAIRRSWRFGVEGDVDVHVVSSELEGRVVENLKRKMAQHEELARETSRYVGQYVRDAVVGNGREVTEYKATVPVRVPAWLRSET